MHNPAYSQREYCYAVSENFPVPDYATTPEQKELTEEKISAIRTVLHKLSTIRVLNPPDAEDLVQDTLLTMLTKQPGSDLEKGLLIWTMGILRKKVGNYYRKAHRFTCFSEQESGTRRSIREFTSAASPEAKFFHEELQDIINRTLALLPSPQRQAVELLIAGLDSAEIVRRFHPERYQNVINYIFRGRQKLAKELAKYGYGPIAKAGMRCMKRCRPKKE